MTSPTHLLKGTRVYLAGAIENDPSGSTWRKNITPALQGMGINVFDPFHRPFLNGADESQVTHEQLHGWMDKGNTWPVIAHMTEVRAEDLRMVDICDFLIVKLDPKVASWGTAEEIYRAAGQHKPMFIAVNGGAECTPLWLMGALDEESFYDSIDDILDYITGVDSGVIPMIPNRWRLLQADAR